MSKRSPGPAARWPLPWRLPPTVRWRLAGLVLLVALGVLAAASYMYRFQSERLSAASRHEARRAEIGQLQDLRTVYGEYRYALLGLLADASERRMGAQAQTRVRAEHARTQLTAALDGMETQEPGRVAETRSDLAVIADMTPRAVQALQRREPQAETLAAELRARLDALYERLGRWLQESGAFEPPEAGVGAPDPVDLAVPLGLLSLTLLCSVLLIRSIVQPLDALRLATAGLPGEVPDPLLPRKRPDEIGAIADAVHRLSEHSRRVAFLAHHDPLSGLGNRSLLQETIEAQIPLHGSAGQALVMLHIGLQQLTTINETFGPAAGDEYIRVAARRLQTCAPDRGLPFHLGGSHFVMLVTGVPNDSRLIAHSERLARNLVSDMSRPFALEDQEVEMAVNVGVATWPQDGDTYAMLLGNAHAALTQATRRGRNHFQFYTRQITDKARSRLALASQLRHAVEAGEFTVHYQPVLDVLEQRPVAAEALIRWRHPQRGLVMPSEFIEVAEETGVIHAMGDWCLAQACLDFRTCQQAGMAPLKLAVNLSARQLNEPGLVDNVEQTLQYTGLTPRELEFEITESAVMQNPDRAVRVLRHLKSLGITLTVDDFGTGYSSLTYLQRFPLDKIKIDRSFVARLNRRRKDELIIAATTGLAADLGLDVIAEGVEAPEQMLVLRQLGCRYMQGFLFARSLTPEELLAWVRSPGEWIPDPSVT